MGMKVQANFILGLFAENAVRSVSAHEGTFTEKTGSGDPSFCSIAELRASSQDGWVVIKLFLFKSQQSYYVI